MPTAYLACINQNCFYHGRIDLRYFNPDAMLRRNMLSGKRYVLCLSCARYSKVVISYSSIERDSVLTRTSVNEEFSTHHTAQEKFQGFFNEVDCETLPRILLPEDHFDRAQEHACEHPDAALEYRCLEDAEYPISPFAQFAPRGLLSSNLHQYTDDVFGILPPGVCLKQEIKNRIYVRAKMLLSFIEKKKVFNPRLKIISQFPFISISHLHPVTQYPGPMKLRLSFHNDYTFFVFDLMLEHLLKFNKIFSFKFVPGFIGLHADQSRRQFDSHGQYTIYLFHDLQTDLPECPKTFEFIASITQALESFPGSRSRIGGVWGDVSLNPYFGVQYDGTNPYTTMGRRLPNGLLTSCDYVMEGERELCPRFIDQDPRLAHFKKFPFRFLADSISKCFIKMFLNYYAHGSGVPTDENWKRSEKMREIVRKYAKMEFQNISYFEKDITIEIITAQGMELLERYFVYRRSHPPAPALQAAATK